MSTSTPTKILIKNLSIYDGRIDAYAMPGDDVDSVLGRATDRYLAGRFGRGASAYNNRLDSWDETGTYKTYETTVVGRRCEDGSYPIRGTIWWTCNEDHVEGDRDRIEDAIQQIAI